MKAFDPNYKLLDEMYQDEYYPAFLVAPKQYRKRWMMRSVASMISKMNLTRTTVKSKQ